MRCTGGPFRWRRHRRNRTRERSPPAPDGRKLPDLRSVGGFTGFVGWRSVGVAAGRDAALLALAFGERARIDCVVADRVEERGRLRRPVKHCHPGTGGRLRVTGFWGLALAGMPPHSIRHAGTDLSAWCAWDPLFLSLVIGDLQVTTADPVTGAAITYRIRHAGTITGASHP